MKVGFLASHGGSAARFLTTAATQDPSLFQLGPVVTNNRDAAIRAWCREHDRPHHDISARTHPDDAQRDAVITQVFVDAAADVIVLSGYMKKIGPHILGQFDNRILNVHPALLPKFGGQGMFGDRVHEAVLASNETISGATVHVVNHAYDEGPVLAQATVKVEASETVSSLRDKVQALEGPLLLKALNALRL